MDLESVREAAVLQAPPTTTLMHLIMNNKLLATSALALLSALGAANSHAAVLAGPILDTHNIGWNNTGIQFTALQDTTLQSFDFQNYGANDTIELTLTDGSIVYSTPFTGGGSETTSTVTANWALTSGTTYALISLDPNNSKYTVAAFPVSNSDIRVDGGYSSLTAGLVPGYWFHFNNLTTGSGSIPEPSSLTLLGLGCFSLLGIRRRAKKA